MIAVVLGLLVIVLTVALGYTLLQTPVAPAEIANSDTSPVPAVKPAQTVPQTKKTNTTTYQGDGFKFEYPTDKFTAVESSNKLPPNYKISYGGIKLISSAAVSKLGKVECEYGQSGKLVACTAEMERGIALYKADVSVSTIVAGLEQYAGMSTITMLGKSVAKWSIGAEGEGADYYFIPLVQNETLVVVRTYDSAGFPSEASLNQVLNTLVFN